MIRTSRWITLAGTALYATGALFIYLGLLACNNKSAPAAPQYPRNYQVPQGTLGTAGVEIVSEKNDFRLVAGQSFSTPFWASCPWPTPETIHDAEAHGGRRVRITYPGAPQPLYGILAFCKLEDTYQGPASRSYQIEIPPSYVEATSGGRISVVYEPYDVTKGKDRQTFAAWAIWLSRDPIPWRKGN